MRVLMSSAADQTHLANDRAALASGTVSLLRAGWSIYLGIGLVSIAVYLQLSGLIQAFSYELFGLSAVLAIIAGVRSFQPARPSPWLLVACGLTMLVVGDLIINGYEPVLGQPLPFPSIADAFFLAGNLTVVAALVLLIQTRVPGGDRGGLIDAAIIATAAGVLSWVFLMNPYASDPTLSMSQRLVSMAYPLIDVLMLAVVARLVFSPGFWPLSLRLVLLAIVSTLVADVIYAELVLTTGYSSGDWVDGIWLLWYVFWGAAALHPSMRAVNAPSSSRQTRLSTRRLLLLSAAALLVPAALLIQWGRGATVDVPIISIGSAIIFLLVVVRMSGLIQAVESARHKLGGAVTREQILRKAAASLVAAPSREGIYAVALDAARELTRHPDAQVRVGVETEGRLAIVAAAGGQATAAIGQQIDLDELSESDYAALMVQQSARVSWVTLPNLWRDLALDPGPGTAILTPLVISQEVRGVIVVAGQSRPPDGVPGGLEALGSQVALALESVALAEDLHRRESQERLHSLVRNASDVILITEADGTISYASLSVTRVLGYRSEEMTGQSTFALVHPDELDLIRAFYAEVITATGTSRAIEYRVRHADGSWRHIETIGNNLLDDRSVRGIVLNSRDITERRQAEEQLAYQAFHDSLTGLPNRALFLDRLEQALDRSARRGETTAVLFLDLDRFKVVNDSLGHEAGDQLLVAVAERLAGCVRPGDTAARLGGDEFTLLLEGVEDVREAVRLAECVAAAFAPAIDLGGRLFFITASIGIALSRSDHYRSGDLLREADIAMYQAKAKGKASYAIFDREMGSLALRRLELETELRRAVEHENFLVEYQPEIDLRTGRIVAMEALVRWEHPERGLVPPAEFIPVAEETGLILPLGRWMLEQACAQARQWLDQYASQAPLVSVNLSVKQFQHPRIVDEIAGILQHVGLPAGSLMLEITETVVMEHAESNRATLERLKDLGVGLAIDDFGSGYSSLGYLKRFPVDVLKIDRAFVSGVAPGREDTAIVEAIIHLAHTLTMRVTAEGVETSQHLGLLRTLGCDIGQGFFFSPAKPSPMATTLIELQPWAAAPATLSSISSPRQAALRDLVEPAS